MLTDWIETRCVLPLDRFIGDQPDYGRAAAALVLLPCVLSLFVVVCSAEGICDDFRREW